jgi:hypothetical protein
MSTAPQHKSKFGWLEFLLIASFVSLLVQIFPVLLTYPWSLVRPVLVKVFWCIDVRNWNWKTWLAVEACVLGFLFYLKGKWFSD